MDRAQLADLEWYQVHLAEVLRLEATFILEANEKSSNADA
jgi:hypothetical protein